MQVSLELKRRNGSPYKGLVLRNLSLDQAVAISAAWRGLPQADIEAVIVVDRPAARKARRAPVPADRLPAWAGWLRGLLPASCTVRAY